MNNYARRQIVVNIKPYQCEQCAAQNHYTIVKDILLKENYFCEQ